MLQIVLNQPGAFAAVQTAEPVPQPGDALVRVHRIGVCGTDLHAFRGKQPFFSYPRVLGHELGVEVIEPGNAGNGIRAGDRCSVEPYLNCGACIACRRGKPNCCAVLKVLGVHTDGGMRPLLALPSRKLHSSATLNYDQLALVETLAIGAHAVERAQVEPEDFVLVIGAGPIGLSVIQFARLHCRTLAVMDISESRLEFCGKLLRVDTVLKPGPAAVEALKAADSGDLPSVVIDATGNPGSMAETFHLAAEGGRIVFVGLFQGDLSFNDPNFHRRELTLCGSRNALPGTFSTVISMIESGQIDTVPWITHRFTLAETPERFPAMAADGSVLKAMVEVG